MQIGSSQTSGCNSVSNWCSVLRGCDKTYLDVSLTNVSSADKTPEPRKNVHGLVCTMLRDISQTKEVPHFFKTEVNVPVQHLRIKVR